MTKANMGADDIDPLTRFAIKYGTDKWGAHFYTPIYHALFAQLRDKPVRLLEIGVGGYESKSVGGPSLSMWAEYFPKGRIVGIDIAEKSLDLGPRVHILRGSQDDADFLARVVNEHGPFDIIIDDGSHIPAHVVASFEALFLGLPDGGLYVIEDVQTTFWPRWGGSRDGGPTMSLARTLLEHINHAEIKAEQPDLKSTDLASSIRSFRAYHNLFVIEKENNAEPSSFAYTLDNPHAARALRTIEAEMARTPTAAGIANMIEVYVIANRTADALKTADRALARWPAHPRLLWAAAMAAMKAGDRDRTKALLRRFAACEPDNPQIRALLDQRPSNPGMEIAEVGRIPDLK